MSNYTLASARAVLRGLGLAIRHDDGEYRVSYKGLASRDRTEETAYYTHDLKDAVDTGRAMAAEMAAYGTPRTTRAILAAERLQKREEELAARGRHDIADRNPVRRFSHVPDTDDDDGPPNLDGMNADELRAFGQRHQRGAGARALFPTVKLRGTRRAAQDLANYAWNKATAMECRERGDIIAAAMYEGIADQIYDALPDFAKW